MMEIDDVPHDDTPAAVAFAVQSLGDGTWNGDVAECLLNKQTNPQALTVALQQLGDSNQDARTGVRRVLGDAAHAMSDQEIDAVIAAARSDADLSDDERAEISALQDEFGDA